MNIYLEDVLLKKHNFITYFGLIFVQKPLIIFFVA